MFRSINKFLLLFLIQKYEFAMISSKTCMEEDGLLLKIRSFLTLQLNQMVDKKIAWIIFLHFDELPTYYALVRSSYVFEACTSSNWHHHFFYLYLTCERTLSYHVISRFFLSTTPYTWYGVETHTSFSQRHFWMYFV